jgi:hypothetical protein
MNEAHYQALSLAVEDLLEELPMCGPCKGTGQTVCGTCEFCSGNGFTTTNNTGLYRDNLVHALRVMRGGR